MAGGIGPTLYQGYYKFRNNLDLANKFKEVQYMKYCQKDLQSRQQLQALRYKIEEIRDILYECANIDKPLQHQRDFYECIVALLEAADHVGSLRKYASPIFLCDLERDLGKVVGE